MLKCKNGDIICFLLMYCFHYFLQIFKSGREMGLFFQCAQKEALKESLDAKRALKKLGFVHPFNREVSAQESLYPLTKLD